MGRRRIMLRGWVVHGIVVIIRRVGASRTVCVTRAVGGALLARV